MPTLMETAQILHRTPKRPRELIAARSALAAYVAQVFGGADLDIEHATGGGCTAWHALLLMSDGKRTELLVTHAEGCEAPDADDEPIMVGLYTYDMEGEELAHLYTEFPDAASLRAAVHTGFRHVEWHENNA